MNTVKNNKTPTGAELKEINDKIGNMAQEIRLGLEKEKKEAQQELVGKFFLSKMLDLFSVLVLVGVIIIVVILFTESLFQGFISLVVGFYVVRFLFKKRNGDFLSKFFGWF